MVKKNSIYACLCFWHGMEYGSDFISSSSLLLLLRNRDPPPNMTNRSTFDARLTNRYQLLSVVQCTFWLKTNDKWKSDKCLLICFFFIRLKYLLTAKTWVFWWQCMAVRRKIHAHALSLPMLKRIVNCWLIVERHWSIGKDHPFTSAITDLMRTLPKFPKPSYIPEAHKLFWFHKQPIKAPSNCPDRALIVQYAHQNKMNGSFLDSSFSILTRFSLSLNYSVK